MPELKTTISDANVNSVNGGIPELVELDADSSPERVEAAHVVPEPPPTVPAENVSTPPAVEAVEAVAKEIPRRESIRHEQDQVVVSSDEDDLSDGEIRVVRRRKKTLISIWHQIISRPMVLLIFLFENKIIQIFFSIVQFFFFFFQLIFQLFSE